MHIETCTVIIDKPAYISAICAVDYTLSIHEYRNCAKFNEDNPLFTLSYTDIIKDNNEVTNYRKGEE